MPILVLCTCFVKNKQIQFYVKKKKRTKTAICASESEVFPLKMAITATPILYNCSSTNFTITGILFFSGTKLLDPD